MAIAPMVNRLRTILVEEGPSGLLGRVHERLRDAWAGFSLYRAVGDPLRLLVWILLLRPAADRLPRGAALGVASTVAFFKALTPFYGLRTTAAVMRMYSLGPVRAVVQAANLLAQPMRDYVAIRRLLVRRDDMQRFPIREVNAEVVRELRETNSSFILATGHFVRRAHIALFMRSVLPQHVTQVSTPLPERSRNMDSRWLAIHFGQLLNYTKFAGAELATPRRRDTFRKLEETLAQAGNAVSISIDAPWKNLESGMARPFAGETSRCFATGAARLARKTGKPIVLCVPYLDGEERIVIEWIRVLPAPDPDDADADVRITDLLMNDVERAIGRHPTQYVIEHLGPRKWNRGTESWE